MPAMIDSYVGRQSAWHNLGIVTGRTLSVDEARRLAFDWEPTEKALYLADGSPVPCSKAITRSDSGAILGVVGANYTPVGNAEAFDWMTDLVGRGELQIETAGALDGGRRVWMLGNLDRPIMLPGNDRVDPYLLVANGHDGSLALSATPTTVRVVCQNTLSIALSRSSRRGRMDRFSIRHTSSIKQAMLDATATLAAARQSFQEFEDKARALATRQVDRSAALDFFRASIRGPLGVAPIAPKADAPAIRQAEPAAAGLWGAPAVPDPIRAEPIEERSDRFAEILSDVIGRWDQEHSTGTAWGAFNAVTEFVDHGRRYRSPESRFQSSLIGEAAQQKERVFNLAVSTFAR